MAASDERAGRRNSIVKRATRALLEKAHRTIEAALRDVEAGDGDNAISRAYYAAFQAATAALNEAGYWAKSHPGTQHLFFQHWVQTGRLDRSYSGIFAALYQMRQEADYAFGDVFTAERARQAVEDAQDFVAAVEGLLHGR